MTSFNEIVKDLNATKATIGMLRDNMGSVLVDINGSLEAVQQANTQAIVPAFYLSNEKAWFTKPDNGTKLSERPSAIQIQFQGQPASIALPDWATSADIRIDSA